MEKNVQKNSQYKELICTFHFHLFHIMEKGRITKSLAATFSIENKYIMYIFPIFYFQSKLKATNVFKQSHNVGREARGEVLGSGFRGCTIWFTGKKFKKTFFFHEIL